MKKIFSAFLLLFLATTVFAQKVVNDANAEARQVGSFHAVSISHSFKVIITQGGDEGLAVSASDKEDIQHIKTAVENGVLKIWFDDKKKFWPRNRKLRAYISAKTLDAIKASGASDIDIEGTLNASSMNISLSGASDLSGRMVVNGNLDVNLSGASDITISGSAQAADFDLSGASDVKGYDFSTGTCKVDASGASGVHITVDKELSARLSGASSVSYKGSAMIRDIRTSGASSISRKS